MTYSRKEISNHIDEVVKESFGGLLAFRRGQREAIETTIYNWLNGTHDEIINAPTGSGKSIIAMIVAAVLSKYYGKSGYILVSDKSLIEQYEKDVKKHFRNWSVITGQQNYKCHVNGLPFTTGVCKVKGVRKYSEIKQKFSHCAGSCRYIIERDKAIQSKVLVCTYAFWLIQQNLVKKKIEGCPPFTSRDFTICDEAHNLIDIVQNHFSPKLSDNDLPKIKSVLSRGCDDSDDIFNNILDIRHDAISATSNSGIKDALKRYVVAFNDVIDAADTVNRSFSDDENKNKKLSNDDKELIKNVDFVEEHFESFNEYYYMIKEVGDDCIIRNETENGYIFNCINESYLMKNHFHKHCENKLYMSATIGSFDRFAKNCDIKDYDSIDIPSSFHFEQSPIFYVPDYKLSYKEKEQNLPKVLAMIDAVAKMYKGQRGIIQTGSYSFSKYILDNISDETRKRIVIYNDTKEKSESLMFFKKMKDKILIGPSLVEGLSFDDDLCRFQIIMKVPYPSLNDNFVKKKMEINGQWYSDTAAISILQGVGRGIRSSTDWCVTFIFDGCFTQLARRSYDMFSDSFKNRVKIIKPSDILGYAMI